MNWGDVSGIDELMRLSNDVTTYSVYELTRVGVDFGVPEGSVSVGVPMEPRKCKGGFEIFSNEQPECEVYIGCLDMSTPIPHKEYPISAYKPRLKVITAFMQRQHKDLMWKINNNGEFKDAYDLLTDDEFRNMEEFLHQFYLNISELLVGMKELALQDPSRERHQHIKEREEDGVC